MADAELQDDDRDTSLPSSALSPAEYRGFRGLVGDLDHTGVDNQVSLYSVLEFLASFNGVTHSVAQKVFHVLLMALTDKVVETVLGTRDDEFVGEGHIYAMIRLLGHWQMDKRIEKSLIFVQGSSSQRTI